MWDIKPGDRALRIEMLRAGETQWGHSGLHHGNGSPDCPFKLHHHHDIKCRLPDLGECLEAGVEYRKQWDSRA